MGIFPGYKILIVLILYSVMTTILSIVTMTKPPTTFLPYKIHCRLLMTRLHPELPSPLKTRAKTAAPFSVPSYFLYPDFQSKAGCCAYVRNDITCSRAHNLDSSELFTIWLKLQCHSLTKLICAVYISPNSFDYLTSKVEHILSYFP